MEEKKKHYTLDCSRKLGTIVTGGQRTLPCLRASSLRSCVAIINPTSGCIHNCIFCYVNATHVVKEENSSKAHHRKSIVLYENLQNKLAYDIVNKPDIEYGFFSTTCDPFQPDMKVLDVTYNTMEYLLKRDKTVSFLTKGKIPVRFFMLFQQYNKPSACQVTAQIGITTRDKMLSRLLEPCTASPNRRLRQVKALGVIGVPTSIRLDPLLPGITDTEDYISNLFRVVEGFGVKNCAISYLMLHGPIRSNLYVCGDKRIEDMLDTFYSETTKLKVSGAGTNDAVNMQYRLQKYAEIKNIGKKYGIAVSVCYCKNSDIAPEASDPQVTEDTTSCNIGNILNHSCNKPSVCTTIAQIEDLYRFDSSK
jgi:DNA repair photolyase